MQKWYYKLEIISAKLERLWLTMPVCLFGKNIMVLRPEWLVIDAHLCNNIHTGHRLRERSDLWCIDVMLLLHRWCDAIAASMV